MTINDLIIILEIEAEKTPEGLASEISKLIIKNSAAKMTVNFDYVDPTEIVFAQQDNVDGKFVNLIIEEK